MPDLGSAGGVGVGSSSSSTPSPLFKARQPPIPTMAIRMTIIAKIDLIHMPFLFNQLPLILLFCEHFRTFLIFAVLGNLLMSVIFFLP